MQPKELVFLILFAVLLASVPASFAETIELTLDDAVALGLKNSADVKAKQLAVSSSNKDVKAAKAAYYPCLSVGSDYSHRFTDGGVVGTSPPDQLGLSLELSQTIYTFGRLNAAVDAAEKNSSLAKMELDEEKRGLAVEIQRAFYSYLLAREVLAAKEESLRYKEEALEVAAIRYEAGLAKRRDLLQAESDLMGFVPETISAQNDVEYALLSLRDILRVEGETDVLIKGELDLPDVRLDREKLIQEALEKNSSIEQHEIGVALQEVQGDLAKTERLPVVSGFASASLSNGFDIGGGEFIGNDWDSTISAGIKIQMDLSSLFPWSKETADVEKNAIVLERMNTELESIRNTVTLNVESILLDLSEGQAKIEAGRKALELADELFLSSKQMYKNGLITGLEYKDAQIGLKDSAVGYLTYIYNYWMSLFELMDAVGADRI